jgi:PIN domain nuclease of toxin-antitoxin system
MKKGRVQVNDPIEWVEQAASQMREAPLTQEIVRASFALPLSHADPADRFLAATAKVLKLTLVTADQRLLGLSGISSLSTR